MNTRATATRTTPRLIAQDVAEAFLRDGPDRLPSEVELVTETAMLIGEHLAEQGSPGEWGKFDAETFYKQIAGFNKQVAGFDKQVAGLGEHELVGISLTVIALYGWLGTIGLVSSSQARQILGSTICFGPPVNFVRSLALSGQRMLESLEFCAADTLH